MITTKQETFDHFKNKQFLQKSGRNLKFQVKQRNQKLKKSRAS